MWTNRTRVASSAESSGTILFTSYKTNQTAKNTASTSHNIVYSGLKVYKVATTNTISDIMADPLAMVKKQKITATDGVTVTGRVDGYNWANDYTLR